MGDLSTKNELRGATDGTKIGNVSDKLKVDIGESLPVFCKELFFQQFIRANGSDNMAVDGGTTPIEFTVDAHATKDIYISHWEFYAIVQADVIVSTSKFLNISALTNGLSFSFKTSDIVHVPLPPIKRTEHMITHFANGSNVIWEEEASFTLIKVTMDFQACPLVLKKIGTYATSDFLKITVNDNLVDASIEEIESSVKGYLL